MIMFQRALVLGFLASCLLGPEVSAGILTTNPGDVGLSPGDATSIAEGRARLNKNTGTGFLIVAQPGGANAGSGSQFNGYYTNDTSQVGVQSFAFSYDKTTGLLNFGIERANETQAISVSSTKLPTTGKDLVGFEIVARASPVGATTTLSGISFESDAGSDSIALLQATNATNTYQYFFTQPVSAFGLAGKFGFNWTGAASGISQEAISFTIRPLEGKPAAVPEPSTILAGALGVGVMGVVSSRRRRRSAKA
jgi:hypothetical protein